jgi:hypothetical protein
MRRSAMTEATLKTRLRFMLALGTNMMGELARRSLEQHRRMEEVEEQ